MRLICLFVSILAWSFATAQIQSPDEFLPHKLGETFTPHHMLVDYMETVAENSNRVVAESYGRTNQDRPLMLAFISSPENLARLEDIRKNNLRRAGVLDGAVDPDLDVAIVWLSYSVHGNEAGGAESSMRVLYELADENNPQTGKWLENTVVIMDPCLNPDGYSRYSHWYRNVAPKDPDPDPTVREHLEPWPGGRVNHYHFDLNRDWAWMTQVESEQRAKRYLDWLPHIHADVHEQGYNSPYYFAPAAHPYHKYISKWQADYQVEIGKNHAKYFDANGWLYFTRESFDLLYPSYGDTYPTFHGSVGMTYEQAGHSRAGRAILLETGDTLTLNDRVAHHATTSLSTVEIASRDAKQIVERFGDYFKQAENPAGDYKTFIIKAGNSPKRLAELAKLMDKNRIQYGYVTTEKSASGYSYRTGENGSFEIEKGDMVISAYQPLGLFAQVLLEPKTEVEDSVTYDITAWSLPYAYGLDAYALTQKMAVDTDNEAPATSGFRRPEQLPYAYLAAWSSVADAAFLGDLLQAGIRVRYALEPIGLEGKDFARGTLVMSRGDNRANGTAFFKTVEDLARQHDINLTAVSTGFSDYGFDLGSSKLELIKAPRVALLGGSGVGRNAFGHAWYIFEERLDYPVGIHTLDQFDDMSLDKYDVLVLANGYYSFSDSQMKRLKTWIRSGGKVIALEGATRVFANKDGFALNRKSSGGGSSASNNGAYEPVPYAGGERRYISSSNPGVIIEARMDNTHPLGFGQPDHYFSLKTNTLTYAPLDRGYSVSTIEADPLINGFVGYRVKKRLPDSLVFGVEPMGRGSIVYLVDDVTFRGFWENGIMILANALYMVQ